ncbi:MAG: hypothetical protein Q8O38_14620 [Sulfurimicrobium sp.]|nr:hypothetical protein [Sulfurimicrobium sp.]
MLKIAATTILLSSLCSSFAFASNADLVRDLKQIKNFALVKGELETTTEFNKRKEQLYERYSKRTYHIELSVKNLNGEREKRVSYANWDSGKQVIYNPDTEELTVSMPEFKSRAVWIARNGEEKYISSFCYIQTEPNIIKSNFYIAQNNFGAQFRVASHVATSYGIAILPKNENIKLQSFTTTVSREKARDILEKGKLVIEARPDLQSIKEGRSLLIIHEYEVRPTINSPTRFTQTAYMLPVNFISMSLYSGNGVEVPLVEGIQQNASALNR